MVFVLLCVARIYSSARSPFFYPIKETSRLLRGGGAANLWVNDVRLRQLFSEFINSVRRKPVSIGKVETSEVPEILERIDAGKLGAVGKVECLERNQTGQPFEARHVVKHLT